MAIAMKCPACGTAFDFPDNLLGKRIKCKSCGDVFKIDPPAPKPAPKPVAKPVSSKALPAVKQGPGSKSAPAVKPAPVSSKSLPAVKPKSKPVMDDEDDEDDRPRGRRRHEDDEDEDDRDTRRRFADEDDEDDDRPAKKKLSPLLIIGPILGVLAVVGIVVAIFWSRGKKDKDVADNGAGTKGPGVSCMIELPEKDINRLVIPDSGNLFATFRKPEALSNSWEWEATDVTTGKPFRKCRIPELETPQYVAMTPDGKYVMVEQEANFSGNDRALTIFDTAANKAVAPKWIPYPRKDIFKDPTLYKAEFLGNDKIITINTARVLEVWQLPSFERTVVGAKITSVGEPLTSWMERGDGIKHERLVAFTADHSRVAVWTGNGYAVVNTADGAEVVRMSTAQMNLKNVKAGAAAWSPNGKTLAMVFEHGNFGAPVTILVLWNPEGDGGQTVHQLYSNQFDQSKGINWWGNRYIGTSGTTVDGMLIDSQTGNAARQVMTPPKKVYAYTRNGRLWYAATPERKDRPNVNDPALVRMVEAPDELIDPNDSPYEEDPKARASYLRRLWLEPEGVLKAPSRYDPPLGQKRIGQP